MEKILTRKFFTHPAEKVARDILGKIVVSKIGGEEVRGRIVETEAYLAQNDEAAHAFRGMTSRNQSLYKAAGHLYVHQSRHHFLCDVVAEKVKVPGSVLIRAVEPLSGLEVMVERRGTETATKLTNGPGNFCQAFGITKKEDGLDVTKAESGITIIDAVSLEDSEVFTTARIGISKSKERLLRFCVKGNAFLSGR